MSFHFYGWVVFHCEDTPNFVYPFGSWWTFAWRRRWHPTPVLLPGKSHGRRSLVGCSPWGLEESDTTERLHFHFSLSCIGEGNGNPLQCSCLENPRDGAAWWAAVSGVAQSRTRLRRLSSSSIKHHSKQRGTNYLHSWIQLRKQGYCPELVCHILSLSHTESQPCDLTSL